MEPVSTTVIAVSVGKTIGDYLVSKGSDQALKQASFKEKVKRIIRQDKKISDVNFQI